MAPSLSLAFVACLAAFGMPTEAHRASLFDAESIIDAEDHMEENSASVEVSGKGHLVSEAKSPKSELFPWSGRKSVSHVRCTASSQADIDESVVMTSVLSHLVHLMVIKKQVSDEGYRYIKNPNGLDVAKDASQLHPSDSEIVTHLDPEQMIKVPEGVEKDGRVTIDEKLGSVFIDEKIRWHITEPVDGWVTAATPNKWYVGKYSHFHDIEIEMVSRIFGEVEAPNNFEDIENKMTKAMKYVDTNRDIRIFTKGAPLTYTEPWPASWSVIRCTVTDIPTDVVPAGKMWMDMFWKESQGVRGSWQGGGGFQARRYWPT